MCPALSALVLALAIDGGKDAGPDKDSEPAALLFTFKAPGRESSRSVQFSPDGTRLACAGWSEFAGVWDLKTGAELLKLTKTGNEWTRLAFAKGIGGRNEHTRRRGRHHGFPRVEILPAPPLLTESFAENK